VRDFVREDAADRSQRSVPWQVWAMALGAGLLRAAPFAQLLARQPPQGFAYLPIGYIPKDWLAYVALIRQPGDTGRLLLANPFTTEPQDGRFVLLFHQLLGAVHLATGIDPFWLLELSRVPLLLVFFAVLWRFLGHLFPERRVRLWGCGLVAFSGGLEPFVLPLAHAWLPGAVVGRMEIDLWHLYGWSGFGAFYNPLWIAALTLLLATLRPLLQPGGPASWRDKSQAAVGFLLLALVHSYSAILAGAVLGGVFLVELALDPPALRARLPRAAVALLPPVVVLGALSAWQLADPVFRASAGGVLGPQSASLGWLPVAYGALAFFALRGFERWTREGHPWRLAVGGWLAGVALLASSPVLNGYHFIFGLHLPLCLAAGPAVAAAAEGWRRRGVPGLARVAVAMTLLFASPVYLTLRALREARKRSVVPLSWVVTLGELRGAPATAVVAPAELGNLIPAVSAHRVWLGQWFMTPDFDARRRWYALLVERPEAQAHVLRVLVSAHHIGALVVPAETAERIAALLAPRVDRLSRHGDLTTIYLRAGAAEER
jgi:hypothetical protein